MIMSSFRSAMEEEMGKAATIQTNTQTQARRKGIGVRVWLVVSESGESHLEEVGKHSIMRRTGLPARDLRVLDPMLSYPSTILGRDRAIVINLEHIKAIITATEVLMINSSNPLVVQFLQDLQNRISGSNGAQTEEKESNNMETEYAEAEPMLGSPSLHSHHRFLKHSSQRTSRSYNVSSDMSNTEMRDDSSKSTRDVPVAVAPKQLPFEFRALEASLESTCRCLESETQTLEEEAYPALDELTSKISTLNLERVRQIKSRLVAISGRVQKVRDEVEHLLDDDNDMAEMYLTEKLLARSLDQTSSLREVYSAVLEEDNKRVEESNSENNSEISISLKPNIEELEMLLEAYFAQIDGILQKLSDMKEYVDDTEDCINIMLDDKQNQLLQPKQFWETAFGTVGGCVATYLMAVGWGKKRYTLSS
ncbi:Magnesium transporter MRS2-like protein [Quillaja saponaria]|uniref:Magnesium transporter n=1 Tax=Quillaja saponaria TaxID=32244 RepID=A0AAD7LF73_QUISA|nr:Magnesium transporter MRS2-like protein [Quillaja saponaria]